MGFKSLEELRDCQCPRCGRVFTRHFPYGCGDKMPRGGLPRYFCERCERVIDKLGGDTGSHSVSLAGWND